MMDPLPLLRPFSRPRSSHPPRRSSEARRGILAGLVAWSALYGGHAQASDTMQVGPVSLRLIFPDATEIIPAAQPVPLTLSLFKDGVPVGGCRCRVLVYAGEPSARVAPVRDLLLPPLKGGTVAFTLNLTTTGPYSVVVDGRPVQPGDFDPFRIVHPLFVSSTVFDPTVW